MIGVADGPTEIRSRPKYFTRLHPVDVFHAPLERDEVAAVVAHHAFRNASRAGGVQDVKRIGCGDGNALGRFRVCY